MKRFVSLVHRPANDAGLREVLFRVGTRQGMILRGLGMVTKRQGMIPLEKGMVYPARGMGVPAEGMLTSGRGIVPPPQGMVPPERGMHPSERRPHPLALGNAFPARKPVFSACFEPFNALQRR